MSGDHLLDFGVYKGRTIEDVAKLSPHYILWISGVKTKYSLQKKSQEQYAEICKEYPNEVRAVKEFVQGRCFQCWCMVGADEKSTHFCSGMKAKSFHYYHPYGKRQ